MIMLLSHFGDILPGVGIFRYITFRAIAALMTAFMLAMLFAPSMIAMLKRKQGHGQPIRHDGPETHLKKVGTPTMGGLLILFSMTISTFLWGNLSNVYLWIVLMVTLIFGAIGFYDDYLKVTKQNDKGFSGKLRLLLEFLVAAFAAFLILRYGNTNLYFPFFKSIVLDLGWFIIPFSAFVIVGAGNSVNFTDGLDGLAIVPVMIAISCYALISYLSGNIVFSEYLQIHFVPGTGELTILAGAVIGSGFGFLWYNAHPAKIFMGDTGSLALGGLLGAISVVTKHEILLLIVGGIFVIEALSVIIQVGSFKLRKKRVFLMAPIHHHFEKKGWSESQVVIRFWIISILFAFIGLSTLKLR